MSLHHLTTIASERGETWTVTVMITGTGTLSPDDRALLRAAAERAADRLRAQQDDDDPQQGSGVVAYIFFVVLTFVALGVAIIARGGL